MSEGVHTMAFDRLRLPLVAIALVFVVGAANASSSPTVAADASGAVNRGLIVVPTSLSASPAQIMSPAVAGSEALASATVAYPGLFEPESPAVLVWAAIAMGFARVGRAVYLRRLSADSGRRRPQRTVTFAARLNVGRPILEAEEAC